ncbi:MAG: esterase family protein [Bacteroides sp.]|nr:esterase family protein [Bacteroides sp.]
MKRKKVLSLLLVCLLAVGVQAARVDTVMVKSPSMNKDVKVVFVVSDKALAKQNCPVLFLLHGYGGNATNWIKKKPELKQIVDEKGWIVVCPDGNDSWYWDSPKDPSFKYETFVAKELVAYTDSHYATIADKKARAITGLSMGGHGALWLATRHKDVFGAVGCMSGGVDIRPFPLNWKMKERLGEYVANKASWDAHTVMTAVEGLVNGDLAITIDCGSSDFFYEVNKSLHNKLLARKIDHDFVVRPGGHTWSYWVSSLDFQVVFFDRFFKK